MINVTWEDFLAFLIAGLVLYYMGVLVLFRNKRPKENKVPKPADNPKRIWHVEEEQYRIEKNSDDIQLGMHEADSDDEEEEDDEDVPGAETETVPAGEDVMDIIQQVISAAGSDKYELLAKLKQEISSNNAFSNPEHRQSFSKLIMMLSRIQAGIVLQEQEVLALWES